jgi:tetratricopeptide (TPR) repeat protein
MSTPPKSRWPSLLPSIEVAVAPLRSLSDDPKQRYFLDAFTDDLVTDLVRDGCGLSLKRATDERDQSRNPTTATELVTDYLITGSLQHSAPETLRLDLQIKSVALGERGWTGRYEFNHEALGSRQIEITRQISRELHLLALQQACRRAACSFDRKFSIDECLSRAIEAMNGQITPELTAEARDWLLVALARDPRNAEALTGLAVICQHLVSNPWWSDHYALAAVSDLGRRAASIALDLAPENAMARCIQGMLLSAAGRLEEAEHAEKQALLTDPELGAARAFLGYNAALLGHPEQTLPAVEQAMRHDQSNRRHSIFFFFSGFAELLLGRSEAAIGFLRKSLERNPTYGSAQLLTMAALLQLGRDSEAMRVAAEFREQFPAARTYDFEQLWVARSTNPAYRAQANPIFDKMRSLGIGG